MRYYVPISANRINKHVLKKLHCEITRHSIILSVEGLFRLHKGILYKYKAISKQCGEIENYVAGLNVKYDDFYWKRADSSYRIPYIHHSIEETTYRYALTKKASTVFVVKETANTRDFYFESREGADNGFVKEDILSFLSLLK